MIRIQELETPIVLIDENKLRKNIADLQEKADQAGVNLRPHVKTHKSKFIADLQIKAGAVGVTASKSSEAAVFIEHGIRSVTVAYPIVEHRKALRLIELAKAHLCKLNFVCDSSVGYKVLKAACIQSHYEAGIYLKIDVGLNRCGFDPSDPKIQKIASKIHNDPYLRLLGLLSHEGQSYSAINKKEVKKQQKLAVSILRTLKKILEANFIPIPELSVGSTPGILAAKKLKWVTEIRPGNYIFLDRTPLRLGLIDEKQIALTVSSTIVSQNDQYYICDAGSKILTSDSGGHGQKLLEGNGLGYPTKAYLNPKKQFLIEKLSEEHGFIKKRKKVKLKIGQRIRIIPNHSCAVVNMVNTLYLIKNEEYQQTISVSARGKLI